MSNIGYFEHTPNGQIIGVGNCQPDMAELLQPVFGGAIVVISIEDLDGVDGANWSWDGENFVERPAIAAPASELAADGIQELIFSFPASTTVSINGQSLTIEGNDGLIFTTNVPGLYKITADLPFPFKPFLQEVIAHEV